MKKIMWVSLVLLFVIEFSPTTTHALSCAEIPSVEEAYEKYDGVIVAYVDEVVRKKERNEVRLTVSKSFKGVEEANLTVEEDITWGSLWGPSEAGEEYLFFLRINDGKWENPLCSPTMKASAASEELGFLKHKEIPLQSDERTATERTPDHKDRAEPASTHWTVIATMVCLIGIILYILVRKRGKKG